MKKAFLIPLIILLSCNSNERTSESENTDTTKNITQPKQDTEKIKTTIPISKIYANTRFRNITVERQGENSFGIKGQGQIFEASFSWVVEDGHEELKKGFQMTDAGAPEWGNFEFTIDVKKKRKNSILTLILFESSPKDGSRQYELPIVLF